MSRPEPRLGATAVALAIALLALSCRPEAGGSPDTTGRLLQALEMRRPQGSGPFPAIMLVPGCSGMAKREYALHYRAMAERLVELGYLVVHVDYAAARELATACGSYVTPRDIAGDISAVATHLRALPSIDAARIDVIGESLGGGGVLAAASRLGPDDLPPFRKAALFYPVCRGAGPLHARAQVLLLVGDQDDLTPPETCRQVIRESPQAIDVQLRVYPGARHGFDLAHLPETPPPGRSGWTSGYDPVAARTAWADATRFLGQ